MLFPLSRKPQYYICLLHKKIFALYTRRGVRNVMNTLSVPYPNMCYHITYLKIEANQKLVSTHRDMCALINKISSLIIHQVCKKYGKTKKSHDNN